jgi:hypothetical protein
MYYDLFGWKFQVVLQEKPNIHQTTAERRAEVVYYRTEIPEHANRCATDDGRFGMALLAVSHQFVEPDAAVVPAPAVQANRAGDALTNRVEDGLLVVAKV